MNRLVDSELPLAIKGGEAAIIEWLVRYASADAIHVPDFKERDVVSQLKDAGYERDVHIGDPKVESDHHVFASWLIGQAIGQLEDKQPGLVRLVSNYTHTYQNMRDEALGVAPDAEALLGGTQNVTSPSQHPEKQ